MPKYNGCLRDGIINLGGSRYASVKSPEVIEMFKSLKKFLKYERPNNVLLTMKNGVKTYGHLWSCSDHFLLGISLEDGEFNESDIANVRYVTPVHGGCPSISYQKGDEMEASIGIYFDFEEKMTVGQLSEEMKKLDHIKEILKEHPEAKEFVNGKVVEDMKVVLKKDDLFEIRYKIVCEKDW